jgi:hypothetical protein
MNMRIRLLALIALGAAPAAHAANGFLEIEVGASVVNDLDIKGALATGAGVAGVVSNGQAVFDTGRLYGVEVGMRNIEVLGAPGFRVGVSWQRVTADLDELTASVTGGAELPAGRYGISRSTLDDLGFNFDAQVDFVAFNVGYEFLPGSTFAPFIGVGVGRAEIENADAEFGYKVFAGVMYRYSDTVDFALRWDYLAVNEVEDSLGLEYDTAEVHSLSATVAVDF